MVLATKCPDCNTTFRITFPELQLFDGKVRCGHCEQPFNAFSALISIPESVIETEENQLASLTHNKIERPSIDSLQPTSSNLQLIEQADLMSAVSTDSSAVLGIEPVTVSNSSLWQKLATNLALIILLCLQLIYFYRTELAIAIPSTRPILENSCKLLQCEVQLPKYSTLLSLESSELRVNPNQQGEIVTLLATIRNHAPFQQAWPQILLTLTDLADEPIASRILSASDYLMDNTPPQFFAPDSEIDIKIYFDNSELKAMGYRLELIYL